MSWLVEVSGLALRGFKRLEVSLVEDVELPVDEVDEEDELDED